jgi:hypothetical protein
MSGLSGHERHSPGNRSVRYAGPLKPGLMFITCPRTWLSGNRIALDHELLAWKDAGFEPGVIYRNGYIWILSPDPGCEL